ncbi:MAG: GAF domain-containing protein [Chloroflexi bacterium]|nr:GAF domain-containing protein [Chloroflexota bacterium]
MDDHPKQLDDKNQSGFFQPLVETVSRTMNLPASVWVLDKEKQALRIAASVGLPSSYVREATLFLSEESITGEAFRSGQVTIVRDIPSEPRWKYKDMGREMGWKSTLCVPIKARDIVTGVLSIYTFVVRDFSDLEKQLLTDYAAQIGLTLEADKRQHTLIRLLDIGDAFARLITEQPLVVLREIAKGACEVTGADCAVIYPYDVDREEFYDKESVAAHGLSKPLLLSERPRTEKGMAAYVRREGEVAVSNIEEEDPAMLASPFIEREGIKSFMGVALKIADRVLGILYVDFRTPHQFSDEEKDTVRLFAHQAAIAIDNSRLYQQAAARAEALRKLYEIAPTLVSLPSTPGTLDDILTRIAQNAQGVLGADLVDLYQYIQSRDKYVLPPVLVGERYDTSVRKDKIYPDDVVCAIVRSRQPQYVPESQRESTLIQPFTVVRPDAPPARFVLREKIRATAAVPLIVGTEVVGVLFANYRTPQTFPQPHKELIELFASQAAIAIHNARLLEQRKALQDIARDITRILDKDELLQKILARSLELLGCEIGSICLLNKATNQLEFQYAIGKERYLSVPVGKGLIGTAAETGEPVRVGDVKKDNRYIEHVAATQSELDVPMLIGEELVGVLNAESTRLDAFDGASEELAVVLADQAAIALYNADLFARIQRRLDERLNDIGALREIYAAMHDEPQDVMRLIAEKAVELTEAKYGGVWLVDRARNRLEFGGLAGDVRPTSDLPIIILDEHSINGWVAITGQSYLCGDVGKDEHYEEWYADTRSQLTVPLRYKDRAIGTLSVESPVLNGLSPDHQQLLEAMAGQAAIAIRNARLVKRMDIVDELGRALTSGIRLHEDEVLDLIHKQASQLMDTNNMYIALYDEATDTVRFGLAFVDGKPIDVRTTEGWQPRTGGKGRTEEIIRTKQPIFTATKAESETWYASPEHEEYTGGPIWASWLGVPMMVGEKVLGVIATYHPARDYVYSGDDLAILQAMANQAAIALDNAYMFYDVNRRLEALVEFGQAVTSSIRLREDRVG